MTCILPGTISAGLTFKKTVTLTAYPADQGWGLVMYLRGKQAIDIVSTASGKQHVIDIPASVTSSWAAGNYGFSIRAINSISGDVYEIDSGNIAVLGDMQNLTEGDFRTHAQKVLEVIEAMIEGRATIDQERYRINNREVYRTPMADLLKYRAQYRDEVRREQARACGKSQFGRVVRIQLS